MSHTPGPWVLSDDDCLAGNVYSTDATGSIVARVKGFEYALRPESEWRANATLIAAAPDLLEAIQLILPLAKGYKPDGQTATARKTCYSLIKIAEEAVARAEGKS
jgi:hypothetical protein